MIIIISLWIDIIVRTGGVGDLVGRFELSPRYNAAQSAMVP